MNFKTIGAFGLCLLAMGACSQSGKKAETKEEAPRQEVNKNLRFESYSYDVVVETDGDSLPAPGSRYVHYNCEGILPLADNDNNVRMLRDSLEAMAGVKFVNDMPEPVLSAGEKLTELSSASTETCGAVNGRLSVSLVNPRVAVFDLTSGVYECLAAHGMTTDQVLNYDLNNGKILSLQDMVPAEAMQALTELVRDEIKEMQVPLLEEPGEVKLPSVFAITPDGIEFVFQPYEIAPYSAGIIRVPVTLNDLTEDNLLTDTGKYIFFGNMARTDASVQKQ